MPASFPRARRALGLAVLLLIPLLGACRSKETPPPAEPATAAPRDPMDLTLQPRPGWTPENTPRKLRILLLLDKNRIRKGEDFGYRLEMQNVGLKPLAFDEPAPSFMRDGTLCGRSGFSFYATTPAGPESRLPCDPHWAAAGSTEPASGFALTLPPGEYLLTRASGPSNRFRALQTTFSFGALGDYRLKAVYAPGGGLRAVSNTVTLTVVP